MATTAIFKETASIKQAVSIINDMDAGKFPRLLSRILQKLHLKAEQSFNEEEEEKLQAAFSLDKQSLKLVLETISFILEQAVYHNLKTPVFRQQLENIHLEPSKTEAFANVWDNAGQETVEKFRQRTLTPKKLETTAWQLNLQMAQSTQAKMKSPQAVLELGVSTEDTKVKSPNLSEQIGTMGSHSPNTEGQNLEKIFVEFNHQELLEFYNKLETIQAQLDSLT
ncbi:COMM domain-containing protein 10 isoform X2 [Hyla sarda]|uniref:COMM domain-containing protein 10 isoform X2 n=1 Tax=Hyla sarda TaxID=327740 RepID=UPI0024C3D801|nr:COMM domain-containing protein 10 isoform X2 [Hyla sarda]